MIDMTKCTMTDSTKKIRLRGQSVSRQVYSIPLEALYYNNQNDRIATQISEYTDKNNKEKFEVDYSDIENYNNLVAEFIKKSNEEAFIKTKNNIKAFGQMEPGVVLSSGIVIDGNRRFTCLRDLYKETGLQEFGYFNAVIIDENEVGPKDIKIMELEIQIGSEEKVGYDIIDRCAGIYRDLIKEGHLLTDNEYASSTDMQIKEVENLKKKAELIEEFLEFFGKDEKFYIAKALKIDGPISELVHTKSKKDEEEWDQIKAVAFTMILNKTDSDITRYVRDYKKYVIDYTPENEDDEYGDGVEYCFEKLNPSITNVIETMTEPDMNSIESIEEKIRGNEELTNNIRNVVDQVVEQRKKVTVQNKPLQLIKQAISNVERVDVIEVNKMGIDERELLLSAIGDLESSAKKLKEEIDAN